MANVYEGMNKKFYDEPVLCATIKKGEGLYEDFAGRRCLS